MANRAFLMLNLSGDPNEEYASEAVAVGASACYPVLWWSLFSQADIVLRTEEWEDDVCYRTENSFAFGEFGGGWAGKCKRIGMRLPSRWA